MSNKIKLATIGVFLTISSAFAGIAFLKHEYVSGLNKVCIYDSYKGDIAITIKFYKICPQSINF